ncbi:MAG: cytochrome c maturation protein CcmE [Thermoplasmatales archaeon]|nr:MAG: cytochrome c maturation protein CcmE [Thermoplasmatales archaeon]
MERKVRKISEKQIKIIAVVIIVVIVVGVLLWGMVPGTIYDVSEILNNPEGFDGQVVNVTGIVGGWGLSPHNFTLVDPQDKNLTIEVTHTKAFPGGFGNEETVVVTGVFWSEARHIESQKIQIGCPSKY